MPPEPRPSFYTLRTSDGHQATIYVPPEDDPWQAATHFARDSFASDSQLAALRIASQAEIAALTAHLEGAQLASAPPPEPGSDVALDQHSTADHQPPAVPARGFHLNLHTARRKPHDPPVWANGFQKHTWHSGVLVVWDNQQQRLSSATTEQALDLLAYLQSKDDWRQHGVVLDTSVAPLAPNQPDRPAELARNDHIGLSPAETATLLNLLHDNEPALRKRAEADEVDRRRRLGQVYTLLIDAAARRRASLAQDETNPELPVDSPARTDLS